MEIANVIDRVEILPSGCWHWRGRHKAGRPEIRRPSQRAVYRVLYEHFVGPLNGLDIHHHCRDKACVNFAHVEPMTRADHARAHGSDAATRNRARVSTTHCPHGHPFDEANTHYTPKGHRRCRTCNREHAAAFYREHHGAV